MSEEMKEKKRVVGKSETPCSIEVKYQELIMAVAQKFPDETRHETALRYIRERETHCNGPCKSNVIVTLFSTRVRAG